MALENGENDNGEAVGTGNDSRLAMLARINDANDEAHADDYASINDDGSTERFTIQRGDGTQEDLVDETAKDPEAEAAIAAQAAESNDAPQEPRRTKYKINGREVYLTDDEVTARVQKIESADQYLAEASRLRNEQLAKAQVPQQRDPEPQQSVEDDLALARAIQMGSEEEAAAAVRSLRRVTPSVTTADISRTIDDRLTFNQAIQQYRKDFADIVSDPVLNNLALETDRKLLAAGDKRPYAERYADIGNTLRNWADGMAQKRNPTLVPGVAKLERKAAAAPAVKAASQKTVSTVEQEADESTSDIISNIAKSRGGPQWMNGNAAVRH